MAVISQPELYKTQDFKFYFYDEYGILVKKQINFHEIFIMGIKMKKTLIDKIVRKKLDNFKNSKSHKSCHPCIGCA